MPNWAINQEIDLQRGAPAPQVWPDALMLYGDNKAHVWRVKVLDGGAAANLAGATVTGYFVRGDGNTVAVQGAVSGNEASVVFASTCYAIEGELTAVMRLTMAGAVTVTLSALVFRVRKDLTDAIVDPGKAIPTLDELLAQIEAMETATEEATVAADQVSGLLQTADDRLMQLGEMADYAYIIVDNQRRFAAGIKKDGTFVIGKASRYPLGDGWIEQADSSNSRTMFCVTDATGRGGELILGEDGCIPDWVLKRWKKRMRSIDPEVTVRQIVCWGDSLTAGSGGGGTSYRSVLQSALTANGYDYSVIHGGVGGEGARSIATRQGAYAVVVNNITIPADSSLVKIGDQNAPLTLSTGGTIRLMRQGAALINPCSIAGILGTMTVEQESYASPIYTYYFQRATAGDAVEITRPKFIHFNGWNYDDQIAIIWIGTNDTSSSAEQIIAEQEKMVERLTHSNYLIIGLTSKAYHADVAEKNQTMMNRWKRRFVDLRRYLLDYGLLDAGITPTQADTDAIASGEIPPSLLTDAVHFNAAGYTVIGNFLYRRLTEDAYIAKS